MRAMNISTNLRTLDILSCLDGDVANAIADTLENPFRIIECSPVVETQVDVLGIDRNVKDPVTQTVAGAEANRHSAVGVVNIFIARRHFFEHQRTQLQSQILNFAIVGLEKLDERWRWPISHLLMKLFRGDLPSASGPSKPGGWQPTSKRRWLRESIPTFRTSKSIFCVM